MARIAHNFKQDVNSMSTQQAGTLKLAMYVLSVVVSVVGILALILYNNMLADVRLLQEKNQEQDRQIGEVREVIVELKSQNKRLDEILAELRNSKLTER